MVLEIRNPVKKRTTEQTACWYTEVELTPGVYEVQASEEHGFKDRRFVRIPGVITDEHFPSGFGGMYYANPNDGKNVGKETTYIMHLPDKCDDMDSWYGGYGYANFNNHFRSEGITLKHRA